MSTPGGPLVERWGDGGAFVAVALADGDARRLAEALTVYRAYRRDRFLMLSPALRRLLDALNRANEGQRGQALATIGEAPDDASVTLLDQPALAYNYEHAARMLDVSERMIKRLVAEGRLPTVTVGASPRIPREALEEFVARQWRRDSATDDGSAFGPEAA